jgi:hypothetical protein
MTEEGPLARRARLAAQKQGGGSLAVRAARAAGKDPMDDLLREQGLIGRKPEEIGLDVRVPSESTDVATPMDRERIARQPDNLGEWWKDAAVATAGLPMVAAQAVPGMERLQAGARALRPDVTYDEALQDIRGVTDEVPNEIKLAAQAPLLMATGRAMTAVPKIGAAMRSPALSGAVIGAADQALDADRMSLEQRLGMTAAGGVIGGTAGKTLDMLVAGGRAVGSKNLGKNIVGREAAIEASDAQRYGAALREAQKAGGTGPEIQQILAHPKIKPYVDAVRDAEQFADASDAEVFKEAYKLMSRAELNAARTVANSDDFAADADLTRGNLRELKKKMTTAADPTMPSFRGAARQHAQEEAGIEAVETGAAAMSRAGMKTNPKNAGRLSQAAFGDKFDGMTLEQRIDADEGVLGQLWDDIGLRPNLISGAGILSSADRIRRAGPILRRINSPNTRTLDDLVRAGLLGTAANIP